MIALSILKNKSLFTSFIFISSFFLFFFTLSASEVIPKKLTIHVISESNGKGLEADQKILAHAIRKLGHEAIILDKDEKRESHADINIFFQQLIPEKFSWAKHNWFIPNPEWYWQDPKLLDEVDLILCRTKEVERIFQERNQATYFLGFTSLDCLRKNVKKDFSRFFHLAGGSSQKGTGPILNLWRSHSYLPHLTLIKHGDSSLFSDYNLTSIAHRVPEKELRYHQNVNGIHLCLSEAEGYGHYLMEAMSIGAVVITTDGPPMNEFIDDPRCLVPYERSAPQRLGMNYYVDPICLECKIESILNLSRKELKKIGRKNRLKYEKMTQEFYKNLEELLDLYVLALYVDLCTSRPIDVQAINCTPDNDPS